MEVALRGEGARPLGSQILRKWGVRESSELVSRCEELPWVKRSAALSVAHCFREFLGKWMKGEMLLRCKLFSLKLNSFSFYLNDRLSFQLLGHSPDAFNS